MANPCPNKRRQKIKCIGVRTATHFESWIWCILLKCLLSLPCIYSNCVGVNITVSVYPQGDVYIPYGEPPHNVTPLELFCVADNYSSKDIEFTLAGKTIPSEIVNSTTRRLYIERPEKQTSTYYCKNNNTGKKCTSRVVVDSPPGNVTDFRCVSKNLDILNCSWSSPDSLSNINYSLTFLINGNTVKPCDVIRINRLRYCTWNTTSQPRYRQQEDEYFFHLTSYSVFGYNEQNITIDHFSVVKPDPPSDLKVISNGSHSVILQWSIPNNMVDLLPWGVDHRIEYQIAKIDNTAYFRSVDASDLPPSNKTYRFYLNNLPYAHMQYEVRIYIKPKKAYKEEFWSDFTYIVFYTASERPKRPPDTTAGAFFESLFVNNRAIDVYWKQIEEYEENGANFTYKVLVKHHNRTETFFPDRNKSLSYVKLKNATLGAIEVSVWSFNMNGSSENSSHLYIPPKNETDALAELCIHSQFTKLAYENGTYKLSWDRIENVDNYTLFWCLHNTTKTCSGLMDFAVLDSKKTSHIIDLPRDHRYQFAISVNNGTRTSGMVWAKCDISKDSIVMYDFPVSLTYDAPGKSYVVMRWTLECGFDDGIITGYNITYCPIIGNIETNSCDNTVGKQFVYVSNPKQMYVNITNLLPFRTYYLKISLNTIYGLKILSNNLARRWITTTEDTPSQPRNVLISNVKSNSVFISWDPPMPTNGIIGKYVIYYGNTTIDVYDRNNIVISGLEGFTNYSFNVQVCNKGKNLCSKVSSNDAISLRTAIGQPSKLAVPVVKNNPDILEWSPPANPAGTVDSYQIKRTVDDKDVEILNTTNWSYSLVHCEGVTVRESYAVRAINFDEDLHYGVMAYKGNVILPKRRESGLIQYMGEWSDPAIVNCRSSNHMALIFILLSIFGLIGMGYGSLKMYKKYRKMEDIKPIFPDGLCVPDKETKYALSGYSPNSDDKPSSDALLLLPNSKTAVSSADLKQKDAGNCGSSDHTDSTVISDNSRGPIDRQASTSDDGSEASLHLETEPNKADTDNTPVQEDGNMSNSDAESSREGSPYFNDKAFRKNPASGYVQPLVNPSTGYMQAAPTPLKNPPSNVSIQPSSSSYVMAGLSPPIFTTGVAQPNMNPPLSSGYVRAEDTQSRSINLSKLGSSPSKAFGPESLPTMPTLPPPSKHGVDSSYIQLQSLDALPTFKPAVRNAVSLKPQASSGYVSPGDAVINKHLNNILSAGQLTEESAILDPTMSPDAYCRFSWSTDPANDNLHSILADSPTMKSSKN